MYFYTSTYVPQVCTAVWTSRSADWASAGMVAGNPVCGQLIRENEFPSPRSKLRIWSRETSSTVPPRVRRLFFTPRLNGVLTHRLLSLLPLSSTAFIYNNTVNRHRVTPEFIGSRNYCVPTDVYRCAYCNNSGFEKREAHVN